MQALGRFRHRHERGYGNREVFHNIPTTTVIYGHLDYYYPLCLEYYLTWQCYRYWTSECHSLEDGSRGTCSPILILAQHNHSRELSGQLGHRILWLCHLWILWWTYREDIMEAKSI
jgi:hypothetical protein